MFRNSVHQVDPRRTEQHDEQAGRIKTITGMGGSAGRTGAFAG
jgi:hypothetical protein